MNNYLLMILQLKEEAKRDYIVIINEQFRRFIWIFAIDIEGASIEKAKQNLKHIKLQRSKKYFKELLSLLNSQNYETIKDNRQKYEQLFIDDSKTKGRS